MWLIILIDGWIIGTMKQNKKDLLVAKYQNQFSSVLYMSNITRAVEHCNIIV